jgi:hypothetical protein
LVVKLTVDSAAASGPVPEVSAGIKSSLNASASDAAVELFAAHRVSVVPVPAPDAHTPMAALAALGIVRFSATNLSGMAALGASTSTLRRTNGRGTSDRDWVAELANQFLGRFKLKLLRAGFELWSMAPVSVGGRLMVTAVSQPAFAPIAFRDSEGGSIGVWIEMELSGPLKVTPSSATGEIPSEGDVILF